MEENRLDECRKIINEVDRKMARLFEKRMEAVRGIAAWKKEHGLLILDAEREKLLMERNLSYLEKEEFRNDYLRFQQAVMDISKDYQRRLNEDLRRGLHEEGQKTMRETAGYRNTIEAAGRFQPDMLLGEEKPC